MGRRHRRLSEANDLFEPPSDAVANHRVAYLATHCETDTCRSWRLGWRCLHDHQPTLEALSAALHPQEGPTITESNGFLQTVHGSISSTISQWKCLHPARLLLAANRNGQAL